MKKINSTHMLEKNNNKWAFHGKLWTLRKEFRAIENKREGEGK